MKEKKAVYSALVCSAVLSVSITYNIFNPFDMHDWQWLGRSTYDIIDEVTTGRTPEDKAKIATIKSYDPLEWACKQATYEVAELAVRAAEDILAAAKRREINDTHLSLVRSEITKTIALQDDLAKEKEEINKRVETLRGMAQAQDALGSLMNKLDRRSALKKVTINTTFDALDRQMADYQACMQVDNKEHQLELKLCGSDTTDRVIENIIATALQQLKKD